MNTFNDFGLPEEILRVLPKMGIEKPTPIQQKAIPVLLNNNKDFIGLAQTGTGKTAAFGLPLISHVDPFLNQTQALILSPTRELGQQIAEQIEAFSKYFPAINSLAVYGGANIATQLTALKKNRHIIIATPGRLIDLIKRKAINIKNIKHVVLDEADEMLNMGFKEELDEILSFTPDHKKTWLFSATMPAEIRRIVKKYMDDYDEISVSASENEVNRDIDHQYILIRSSDKREALTRFLDADPDMRCIIFTRTKMNAQELAVGLQKMDYRIDALHGDLSQYQRDQVMGKFKSGVLKAIIATDVAARGIDVNDLTHVVHYSLPEDFTYYTHRSGRTARAGKKGISLAFCTSRDLMKIKLIEKKLKIKFEKAKIPDAIDIQLNRVLSWAGLIADTDIKITHDSMLLQQIQYAFSHLSKDELMMKLISNELSKLSYNEKSKNLNISQSSEKKAMKSTRAKMKRMYINIGSMDKLRKREIIDFIVTESNIKKQDIGDVQVEKKGTYFEMNEKFFKKVIKAINGFEFNGRRLRANIADKSSRKTKV